MHRIQSLESEFPKSVFAVTLLLACACSCLIGCKSETSDLHGPTPEVFPAAAITAPSFVLANGTGTAVIDNPDAGFSYQWTVSGGAVVGASTGSSIAYQATGAGPLTVSCSTVDADG